MIAGNQLKINKEITALYANMKMIQNMVNSTILEIPKECKDVVIRPHEIVHQKFFNILLVDFLSGPEKEVLGLSPLKRPQNNGYLSYLSDICSSPQLNNINGLEHLAEATQNLIAWLKETSVVENVWFPSIDTEVTLNIPRFHFIKICGDISKHGFIRLNRRIKSLIAILKKHSISISEDEAYLVLPEFYQWFHDDIFNYHLTTIVELLNNINWAIYEYVEPIRDGSFVLDKSTSPLIKHMYSELRRFKPYAQKFTTTRFLKMRY